jgi:hypothetical protein
MYLQVRDNSSNCSFQTFPFHYLSKSTQGSSDRTPRSTDFSSNYDCLLLRLKAATPPGQQSGDPPWRHLPSSALHLFPLVMAWSPCFPRLSPSSFNASPSRAAHSWSSANFPLLPIMFIQSLKRPRDEDLELLGANESRVCLTLA